MPWKVKSPMDLRKEMMTRLAAGERMVDLCQEYGISRKTGHKFKERFERLGGSGLADQSRAPRVIPHRTPPELVELVVSERREHPSWGARKLKAVLEHRGHRIPSHGAIERIISKAGLVEPRKRRPRHVPCATPHLRGAEAPNDVWCIDYKGQFRLGDHSYCYPLTISDQYSRYLLACEGMAAISDEAARDVCQEVFSQFGIPTVIRSDNGIPFASRGLAGLTKLSVYFLRVGIELERIAPGHPEDNGRHERMHRTLKAETTRPARTNLLQQQERFDDFLDEFNTVRPHDALELKRPVDVYQASSRTLPTPLPELSYPYHDDAVRVSNWGEINIPGVGPLKLTTALAGQTVGIREESDGRWLVSFASIDLGFAHRGKSLQPINPIPNHV
jgi:transposase InsO family protein